jgi:hypothetical protein
MRAKPVWYAGGDVYEGSRRYFARILVHLDQTAAIEGDVAMFRARRIGRCSRMNMVRRRTSIVVVHLASLNRIRERDSLSIGAPDRGFSAKAANSTTARVTEGTKRAPIEEIARSSRETVFYGHRRLGYHDMEEL